MRRIKASAPADHDDNCTYATIEEEQVVATSNQTHSIANAEETGVYEIIDREVYCCIDEDHQSATRKSLVYPDYEEIDQDVDNEKEGDGEQQTVSKASYDHDEDIAAVESEEDITVLKNDDTLQLYSPIH